MTTPTISGSMTRQVFFDIIAHPSDLWKDVKSINKEGRWSYKSSHSSRDNGSLVNGTILWIVWGSEFILLLAFLVGGVRIKSKEPFIESEDDWAEYKNLKGAYKFMVPEDIKSFKVSMEQSPYTLLIIRRLLLNSCLHIW